MALALHAPSFFKPSVYAFSPADVMLRQPELGGSPLYTPANRLLIDPVLQFEPWDTIIRTQLRLGQSHWWNSLSGTGAPLAGNGQSQLFDPVRTFFRFLPSPWATSAESVFRYILASLGIYKLCQILGLSHHASFWSATTCQLTGFFTLWRLYPLVAVGGLIPWCLFCFERLRQQPSAPNALWAALLVAWLMVSGNVQIAAIGLLCTVLLIIYNSRADSRSQLTTTSCFTLASLIIGVLISAPAWVSLADYLLQSPILADRIAEHQGTGRGATSRWADLPTFLSPFIYGSERKNDANFHKALGASNINEAASGYVGLIPLVALIPLALSGKARSNDRPASYFALMLFLSGLWIGYRLPPFHRLWPHLPVLRAIDPRRFTILCSLGGTILSGIGLTALAEKGLSLHGKEKHLARIWLLLAIGFGLSAPLPYLVQSKLKSQAEAHYNQSVEPGPNKPAIVQARVAEQLHGLTVSWPKEMITRSLLIILLITGTRLTSQKPPQQALIVGSLAFVELFSWGWNYNPHTSRVTLAGNLDLKLITEMKKLADIAFQKGHEARFLAVGEAFPPNQLMRFGLKDLRNYDSIEILRTLTSLDTLFDSGSSGDRTSRRPVNWAGVARSAAKLKSMGVIGVVGLSEPPQGIFMEVRQPLQGVWLGIWPSSPRIDSPYALLITDNPGLIEFEIHPDPSVNAESINNVDLLIRESFDPGWHIAYPPQLQAKLSPDPQTGMIRFQSKGTPPNSKIRLVFRPDSLWLAHLFQFAGFATLIMLFLSKHVIKKRLIHFPIRILQRYDGYRNAASNE